VDPGAPEHPGGGRGGQRGGQGGHPHGQGPQHQAYYWYALQRTNTENLKQIFPEKELGGHSPNFHIQVSVSDLYIPMIDLPTLLQEICGPILRMYV